VSFADGAELAIQIDGTEVDTEYTQLNVAGTVDLTGAALTVRGAYSPAVGDVFTVVNNGGSDPIIGTFDGLPEGAVISDFLGSGLLATITYIGGDGNDVVLTVQSCATRIDMTIVREPTGTDDDGEVETLPASAIGCTSGNRSGSRSGSARRTRPRWASPRRWWICITSPII
jgi:hypothetical protein